MSSSPSRLGEVETALRLARHEPYLRLQHVTLFVRDQDESLRFFVDRLGFALVADYGVPGGGRWVAIAPSRREPRSWRSSVQGPRMRSINVGQARQIVFLRETLSRSILSGVSAALFSVFPRRSHHGAESSPGSKIPTATRCCLSVSTKSLASSKTSAR
jgi:hypothetical protein